MPHLFLLFSLLALAGAINVWRPLRSPTALAGASFAAGWLTGELPLHHLALQIAVALGFVWAGALDAWPGRLGIAVAMMAWALLLFAHRRSHVARDSVERALRNSLGEDYDDELPAPLRAGATTDPSALAWKDIVLPFPIGHTDVERTADIVFHTDGRLRLRLDVYRHRSQSSRKQSCGINPPATKAPALLYVHGGGWVIGKRSQQGLPFMHHLASLGWVCFAIDYRLSPRATFPDHLVDVKRAIAWVRAHAADFGATSDFLIISGNSAGGHLSSLAALTANQPEYQPGFEAADTKVDGCIPFYGVYDFADRFGHWPYRGMQRLVERHVMKATIKEAPAAFEKASPIACVREDAPPFFIIHGDADTLVPVEEARRFKAVLGARSRAPVGYAEIPGGQHAFEVFPSVRTHHTVAGAARFASVLFQRHLNAKGAETKAEPSALLDVD